MPCTLVTTAHPHAVDSPVVCLPAGLQMVACTTRHPRLCDSNVQGFISRLWHIYHGLLSARFPLGWSAWHDQALHWCAVTDESHFRAVWQHNSCGQIWKKCHLSGCFSEESISWGPKSKQGAGETMPVVKSHRFNPEDVFQNWFFIVSVNLCAENTAKYSFKVIVREKHLIH